jgi:hypothetical protein
MKRYTLLFCLLFLNQLFAQNKLNYSLNDFQLNVKPDSSEWRRVTYLEAKEISKQKNVDLDNFLQAQKFIAAFFFIPNDSINYPRCTSVSIYIDSLKEDAPDQFQRVDSSFNSFQSTGYLEKFSGGSCHTGSGGVKIYSDSHTQSTLYKFTTVILPLNQSKGFADNSYERPPDNFLIVQTRKYKNYIIRTEY